MLACSCGVRKLHTSRPSASPLAIALYQETRPTRAHVLLETGYGGKGGEDPGD